jgi:flagellar biosynthetic protein FlhB
MPNFGKLNPPGPRQHGLDQCAGRAAQGDRQDGRGRRVAWLVVMSQKEAVMGLAVEPLAPAAPTCDLIGVAFLFIVGALGADRPDRRSLPDLALRNKLKMTRQEMIQESKESDGNPQIKAKIRQMQREMARAA